ncbi:uncharacterized protein EV154DRAFT_555072 [Mucor mucedo]|uniref:uncharacterized protein n=1 Tax=Mucor mucedo TaxID=29922 RepID=UPI00222027FC|nr:uncharacterized protein EV154DRAFT_555072 [Mucor mucedo]KAI7882296.1 hypothetical protein EV154DRAFT_555072 [Mucor mucedo]
MVTSCHFFTYFFLKKKDIAPGKTSNDKGFKIYQCKRMWYAKSLLRESFKSDNQTHRRRNQQDLDSSHSINDAFEDMGRDESPIIADVLSPPPEVANEPSRKRTRRR